MGSGEDGNEGAKPLGLRCPRCSAPLSKDLEASTWTIPPIMRECFAMVGAAAGGGLGAFYGFNMFLPHVSKWVKGPMRTQFLAGLPPVLLFSVGCAGLAGGALPGIAQLAASTYFMTEAASHSAISNITLQVEGRRVAYPRFASQLHRQSDASVGAPSTDSPSSADQA